MLRLFGVGHQRLHRQEPCLGWTSAADMPTHMHQDDMISMTGHENTMVMVAVPTGWTALHKPTAEGYTVRALHHSRRAAVSHVRHES